HLPHRLRELRVRGTSPLASGRALQDRPSADHPEHQRDEKQQQHDEEDDLGDSDRRAGDAAKAEHRGDERDDQQGYDQVEHDKAFRSCLCVERLVRQLTGAMRPSASRSWPPSMPASVAAAPPNSNDMKVQNEKKAPALAVLSAASFTVSRALLSTAATRR